LIAKVAQLLLFKNSWEIIATLRCRTPG